MSFHWSSFSGVYRRLQLKVLQPKVSVTHPQPPLQPRPLSAPARFVLVCVPVRRHFLHFPPKALPPSPHIPPPPVPTSSPDDGRDPEHGRLKLGQRVPGEFAIYSKWFPPTGGLLEQEAPRGRVYHLVYGRFMAVYVHRGI